MNIYLKWRGHSRHAAWRCMTIYGAKSAKPCQKFIRQWKSGKPFYVGRSKSTFIQTQRNENDIHPNPAEHERYSSKPSGTKTTFIQTQRNKNNKFVKTACGRSKFSGVIYAWCGIYKFGRRFKLTVNLRVVFLFFTHSASGDKYFVDFFTQSYADFD